MVIRSVFLKKVTCLFMVGLLALPLYAVEQQPAADSYEGLNTWNKAVRTVDTYLLKPWTKYHKPMSILLMLAAMGTVAYWGHNCTREANADNSNWLTNTLKKYLGVRPDTTADNHATLTHFDPTEITRFNKFITYMDNNPIKSIFTVAITLPLVEAIREKIGDLKLHTWWEKQRGLNTYERQQFLMKFQAISCIEFKDLIGQDNIKTKIAPLMEYAKDPINYTQTHENINTNYLFYGVSGTGKTCFAQALMREVQKANPRIRTFRIPAYVLNNLDAEELQNTLKEVQKLAPCVICIDQVYNYHTREAQTLGRKFIDAVRAISNNGTLTQSPDQPVFLIVSTNKLEAIDISAPRLDFKGILFCKPTLQERGEHIRKTLQSQGVDNIDVEILAHETEDFSFQRITGCFCDAWITYRNYIHQKWAESPDNNLPDSFLKIAAQFPFTIDRMLTGINREKQTVSIAA